MTTVCGWAHEYDDRTCARPKGHLDLASGWGYDLHEAADGYRWIHHEEMVGEDEDGDEVWDIWDEPAVEETGQ